MTDTTTAEATTSALGAAVKGSPPAAYLAATKVVGLTVSDWITVLTLVYMMLLVMGQLYPNWRRDLLSAYRGQVLLVCSAWRQWRRK